MNVTIKRLKTFNEFTTEIWFYATTQDIKKEVKKHRGIPVKAQALYFKGTELQDDLGTEHYGIVEGSQILLSEPYMIPVKVVWGRRSVTVVVAQRSAVKKLRTELAAAGAQQLPEDGGYFFKYISTGGA